MNKTICKGGELVDIVGDLLAFVGYKVRDEIVVARLDIRKGVISLN